MADELLIESVPELNRPVLIAAFRGWNDGGQGASLAGGYLAKIWRARQFATIDPEGFYDFQATRPQVTLVDGITRRLEWPENAFYHAHAEGIDRDVVILLGIEPNLRWRTFCDLIVGLARNLGVELVVTLGALLADVPHTRPSAVTGSASDPTWSRRSASSSRATRGRRASSACSTTPSASAASPRRASGPPSRTTCR